MAKTNLGEAETYFEVTLPFPAYLKKEEKLKKIRTEKGDQIHVLDGGIFYVQKNMHKGFPIRTQKQPYGNILFPTNKLKEIHLREKYPARFASDREKIATNIVKTLLK